MTKVSFYRVNQERNDATHLHLIQFSGGRNKNRPKSLCVVYQESNKFFHSANLIKYSVGVLREFPQ